MKVLAHGGVGELRDGIEEVRRYQELVYLYSLLDAFCDVGLTAQPLIDLRTVVEADDKDAVAQTGLARSTWALRYGLVCEADRAYGVVACPEAQTSTPQTRTPDASFRPHTQRQRARILVGPSRRALMRLATAASPILGR